MKTPNSSKLLAQAGRLHGAGKPGEALELYNRMLAVEPDNFDALNLAGAAALQTEQIALAEQLLNRAIACGAQGEISAERRVRLGDAYNNMAITLQKQRKFDDALVFARQAIEYRPGDADLIANTGLLLREVGKYEDSEALLRQAIAINPRHTRALTGLALMLLLMQRRAESMQWIDKALAVDPKFADALSIKGNLLVGAGDPQAALRAFDLALASNPGHGDALYNRSMLYLALGKFGAGWPDYYRYHPARRIYLSKDLPLLPERLDGQHVFINRNQGLGDELFFMRFIPELKRRGARVSYRGDQRLTQMLSRVSCIDTVIPDEVKQFRADYITVVDQLPYLLQAGDADVPPSLPLPASNVSIQRMALQLMQAGTPPYVGVTWRAGRARHEVNVALETTEVLYKEIPPDLLGAALRNWPGSVLILQRNPTADEVTHFQQGLGKAALDFSAVNDNLEDMLALLNLIERYVTVSNTNLHLRAGTGLPAHVLVPNPPEWRWGHAGRSLWFPDCPVFRQPPDGNWQAALEALGGEVAR